MNYELAKQLKTAGFAQPQDDYGGIYLDEHGDWTGSLNEGAVYAPTLSELIEACGDKFWSLERDTDDGKEWHWVAMPTDDAEKNPHGRFGSTPDEAVARLWIALNKK